MQLTSGSQIQLSNLCFDHVELDKKRSKILDERCRCHGFVDAFKEISSAVETTIAKVSLYLVSLLYPSTSIIVSIEKRNLSKAISSLSLITTTTLSTLRYVKTGSMQNWRNLDIGKAYTDELFSDSFDSTRYIIIERRVT